MTVGLYDRDYMRHPPSESRPGGPTGSSVEDRLAKLWGFVVIVAVVSLVLIVIAIIAVAIARQEGDTGGTPVKSEQRAQAGRQCLEYAQAGRLCHVSRKGDTGVPPVMAEPRSGVVATSLPINFCVFCGLHSRPEPSRVAFRAEQVVLRKQHCHECEGLLSRSWSAATFLSTWLMP